MSDIDGHDNALFHVTTGGVVKHRYRYEAGDPVLGELTPEEASRAFDRHMNEHQAEVRQAARALRLKIHRLLAADPKVEFGEILCIDVDPQGGDLLVTEQGESGNNTWRIKIIKEA